MNPDRYISHGFYRVTDREANDLARDAGAKSAPGSGMELRVQLPDGSLAWLSRTPYSFGPKAPRRGWVYAVSDITKQKNKMDEAGRQRSASSRPV